MAGLFLVPLVLPEAPIASVHAVDHANGKIVQARAVYESARAPAMSLGVRLEMRKVQLIQECECQGRKEESEKRKERKEEGGNCLQGCQLPLVRACQLPLAGALAEAGETEPEEAGSGEAACGASLPPGIL